ncbi:uncharacterized protein [Dermacentor andersoni]|uniref:uncharacterized protein n=1 Tax=Dermacentor andersoni TaxID=34620 RepID=UPI003B3B5690
MQNQVGAQQGGATPAGSPTPSPGNVSFGRSPSTTVIVNLSREKLNRGGARPIFPSVSALPALQNMQRMQQGMLGMGQQQQQQQPNLAQLQQAALLQQAGGLGGQQASLGALLSGLQGSLGGLQGLQGLQQPMSGMQQSSPTLMGQATIGMPPGNMSLGLNLGMGMQQGQQQQQQQYNNLLAQQQAAANLLGTQRSSLLGGQQSNVLGQQSSLLAALQNQQQNRMLAQQGSGQLLGMGQLGGSSQMGMMNTLTGSVSSNPQLGLLSASLMSNSPQISQQKSQGTFNALMPASRASKPLLQAMETLQGGAPGLQGISGPPALAGTPAPIVMSQPITNAGLAPQMQHLLLKGLPGYTSTLVLILVPQD